jgi:hypothetical protein
MKKISHKGCRFPLEIIQQAIWLYVRFTLSFRDVEDLLAERGIMVSYETVRRWVNHFGPMIAANLRKRRPKPYTTWHLDEVYLKIDGRMVYLWRAIDAVETFAELRSIAGRSNYVFPSPGAEGFMSNNTMLFAMYRMGFHGRATVHGFRAVASTLLNEMGFRPDWIERQLAHDERNKVRAAYYNHAQYLPERRRMMQQWADCLDDLAEDGKVIVHHFGLTV